MSEPKKHHYVPRAYLRFFAQENKPGIYQIAVFDKISGRSYASNIDNVAEEKNYNRVEIDRFNMSVPNKNPLFYERLYPQIIEDKIPTIIQRSISAFTLTNAGKPVIADNLKADLAKMLAIQTMRTPRNRTFFYDICRAPFMRPRSEPLIILQQILATATGTTKSNSYKDLIIRTNSQNRLY